MSRWFRVYDEMLDDPKVQRLHPALFKVLINLWCLASRHDGRLPSAADMSFSLRMSEDETFRAVSKLAEAGLIDTDPATGEQRPHGWDSRQFRSDTSTDRVRAHRKRQKAAKNRESHDTSDPNDRNGDETFHGTAPDTDTDTDTLTNVSGTVVPHPATDFCKAVFDSAIPILLATGVKDERAARSLIGRWRKKSGDPELLNILKFAEVKAPSEAVEYITRAVENQHGRTAQGIRDDAVDPLIARARAINAEREAQGAA